MTNLTELVVFSLLSGLATGILTFIKQFIGILLLNTDVTNDEAYNAAIGKIIIEHGWCSGRCIQPRHESPSNGWHLLPKYGVLVYKTGVTTSNGSHSWTDYTFTIIGLKGRKRQLESDIKRICEGKCERKNQILNIFVDAVPYAWRPTQRTRYMESLDESLWTLDQRAVTKTIVKQYLNKSRSSILVAGKPKTGKSTLADTIASYLLTEYGIRATIINGMNPDRPISIGFISRRPTRQNPHIYIINEIETAVTKALGDKNDTKNEEKTYADSKSCLNDYMDRCSKDDDVIRIYTTNEESLVTDLNNGIATERNVFFRDGRIDARYLFTETVGTSVTPRKHQKHAMTLRSTKKFLSNKQVEHKGY